MADSKHTPEPGQEPRGAHQSNDYGADIYAGLMATMEAIGDEFTRLAKTKEQKALAKGFSDFVAGQFHTLLAHLTDPARGSAPTASPKLLDDAAPPASSRASPEGNAYARALDDTAAQAQQPTQDKPRNPKR